GAIDFGRDIRPILFDHCVECHGPDPEAREANLRLDTREGALELRERGAAIVAGNRDASLLWKRVTAADPESRMPPPEAKKPLEAREIELLGRFIDAGAPWSEHWAFITPVRPEPPSVANADELTSPIDRFVAAKLEAEGLKLSPEADAATLLRRVTLALTGLPPTPDEVRAFL